MIEIVLSAPGKNALGTSLMESLRARIAAAAGEPLLLTGAGDAFSAGLNLGELAALDRDGARRLLAALEGLVESLFTYPGPTVALVNGHAIAGGCILALCCDLRVAASDPRIRIGLNETANGLALPPRTLAVVRARVPPGHVDRVILEAGLHPPEEAKALGLVDEVAADARAAALAHVARLAAHPPAAYARAKARLRRSALVLSADEERILEEELIPAWGSEETRARAAAILRKR